MSVTTSVRVEGAEVVRMGLQNLDREIPRIGGQQIYDAMIAARKEITTYPPIPIGSRYERTGTYKRAFQIRKNPRPGRKSVGYSLIGRAVQRGREYTKHVGGDAFGRQQAWMHQTRWPLIRDEVEKQVKRLPPAIEGHLKMAIRRNRL